MITFSLHRTAESGISLDELWEQAVPAVIKVLSAQGYTVDPQVMADAIDEHGRSKRYRVEPGPASLIATASDADGGAIEFLLDGPRFGMATVAKQTNPVLWMALIGLGVELGETYTLLPSVSDPDTTPGAIATTLPHQAAPLTSVIVRRIKPKAQ